MISEQKILTENEHCGMIISVSQKTISRVFLFHIKIFLIERFTFILKKVAKKKELTKLIEKRIFFD